VAIILIIPTLCHYKLCAKTKLEQGLDVAMLIFSFGVLGLCTYNGIKAWGEPAVDEKPPTPVPENRTLLAVYPLEYYWVR